MTRGIEIIFFPEYMSFDDNYPDYFLLFYNIFFIFYLILFTSPLLACRGNFNKYCLQYKHRENVGCELTFRSVYQHQRNPYLHKTGNSGLYLIVI